MKNIYIVILIAFLSKATAQDILWERSYGGKHADYLLDAQATADYGFILAGASLSVKSGNKEADNIGDLDYWLWKMDEKGDVEWQKSFGGSGADLLYSINGTSDGGFILAGTSESNIGFHKKGASLGKEDIWVIKLNAKGDEQWQVTLGGAGQDFVKSILQTPDGGYIIGGSSSSPASEKIREGKPDPLGKSENDFGGLDFWVVKLDNTGKIKWQRTIGGQYNDILKSIALTKDEGYILGGYSNSTVSQHKSLDPYGEGDYWIVKLDKDGKTQWETIYGGEADDNLAVIVQSADGSYLIGGNSASSTSGNKSINNKKGTDFWILRLDEKGQSIWQKTFDTGKVDILTSMVENADGTILLGGYAQSEVIGQDSKKDKKEINDYVGLKISAEGKELWREVVGSRGEDHLKKLIETRDGGFILAGTSKGEISRDRNSGHGNEDFWVVKLKDKEKEKKDKDRKNIEAIPNPAADFTNVIVNFEFDHGTATVYDLAGRQLQSFEVSSRTIPVELTGYPEGLYIVEVRTNKGNDSVKVMKGRN
ncbi:T9SS type A sorting domain-containing protein [Flavobacterium sp. DG1-102-2]|uniref:T9SS type A sorting domain-containing protein n=1 Tax=Flavobacterium sp. DG1-102-2 TaxID=3081663 RepID=UPI0029497367|nr:T9SS type A sorting domain-containing protein [Flavobacterium sp. DG1-102-2]MDV6167115.1 T9SS type A sorting domain-containing protein [Flavobacterium sp. DG1-102-2]